MKRPTKEEHVAHLREGISETCLVCDQRLFGSWTDFNGQIRCSSCGTTYQLIGKKFTTEFLNEIGLADSEVATRYCDCFCVVPLLRKYWADTQRPVPFGSYFGGSPIPEKDYTDFREWLKANATELREEFEDDFRWEKIVS